MHANAAWNSSSSACSSDSDALRRSASNVTCSSSRSVSESDATLPTCNLDAINPRYKTRRPSLRVVPRTLRLTGGLAASMRSISRLHSVSCSCKACTIASTDSSPNARSISWRCCSIVDTESMVCRARVRRSAAQRMPSIALDSAYLAAAPC